jgi:PiT family inorganic phosphate transporter
VLLMISALVLSAMLAVGYFNGANDVSKSIATLVGSGVTRYRTAVVWVSIWTFAGGAFAAVAAQGLVAAFSGQGVLVGVPDGPTFIFSVAIGALAWIWIATATGMPVSTTHALTGGLVGAGVIAVGMSGIEWSVLVGKFALPLDASKILGLGVVAAAGMKIPPPISFLLVALAMSAGSVFRGFKVTETLARKVTPMAPLEGFAANLVTAVLVIFASRLALPVSTTHVSSAAIVGIGLKRNARDVRWKTVGEMLLAWIVTVPTAAAVAAITDVALRFIS